MSTLNVEGIKNTAATSNAITLASDGTCTAKVTNNLSNRNLIINGAMTVNQRGSSTTTIGDFLADRWRFWGNGGTTTYTVESLSSGDPYDLGFRKFIRLTNTANASGATNYRLLRYVPEAQDMANSGWNYTSASSYITLSFWIRSSIAQNFYAYIHTQDGTEKNYIIETGALTANTWTKITKTIPGGTGVQFNNDYGQGARIDFVPFWGTDYTGSVAINEWVTYSGSLRTPDMTNTWAATNGATFDLTGVQLEVGDTATDFEHILYGDELVKCQRYCRVYGGESAYTRLGIGIYYNAARLEVPLDINMRAQPTMTVSSASHWKREGASGSNVCTAMGLDGNSNSQMAIVWGDGSNLTAGEGARMVANNTTDARIILTSEP